MKINFIDNNNLVIYLKKEIINDIDFNIKEELETYFKQLFKKLKSIYNIEIQGYYNIKVFIDDIYGVVLEMKKEELDYYDYFDSQVDMRINCINNSFLYEIIDLYNIKKILKKVELFKSDNHLYVKLKNKLDITDMYLLLENSQVIYDTNNINNKKLIIDKI